MGWFVPIIAALSRAAPAIAAAKGAGTAAAIASTASKVGSMANQGSHGVTGQGSQNVYEQLPGSAQSRDTSKAGTQFGLNSAYNLFQSVAGLFRPNAEGYAKIQATVTQQDIEKRGAYIEQQVNSGAMDPSAGLQAIDQLMSIVGGGSMANQFDARGQSMAMMQLSQIRTNIQQKVNWNLAKPGDKGGGAGLAGISTDPGFQQSWVKNAMLNKMAGFERGNQQLAGSPLEGLFKGPFDVQGGLDKAMSQSKQYNPDYKEPSRFDILRKRLAGGIDGSYFKG